MKKADLYNFQRGLEMTTFEHPRVTYAVNKNKRLVKQVIEDMELAIKPVKEIEEFNKEREELAKKHARKDEKGNPKTKVIPGNAPGQMLRIYDLPEEGDEHKKYLKELDKLEKKYEKERTEHEAKIKKYNEEFLQDDSEFTPHMLDIGLLAQQEKCPQEVMDLIHWMIKEE